MCQVLDFFESKYKNSLKNSERILSVFKALISNLHSLQEQELRNSKGGFWGGVFGFLVGFFFQKAIQCAIIFSLPCTSSTF